MEKRDRGNIPRYLAGLIAALLSLVFLYQGRSDVSVVAASSFLLIVSITDTLYARIFNAATLTLLIAGIAINWASGGIPGLLLSVRGLLLGLALLMIPYLFGGMGAGDVKALAALGALLGAAQVFQVFLYTALIGGLLGLLHIIFAPGFGARCRKGWAGMTQFFLTREIPAMSPRGKGTSLRFPYAAAIALGFFSYLTWGEIL